MKKHELSPRQTPEIESNHEVEAFLSKQGYSIEQEISRFSYIMARISKEGKEYFLKMPKESKVNPYIQNEIAWNNQVNALAEEEGVSFHFPEVHEQGNLTGKLYGIFEAFPEKTCMYQDENLERSFIKKVPQIVDFLFWIKGKFIELPLDKEKKFPEQEETVKDEILNRVQRYSEGLDRTFPELEKIIENTEFKNLVLTHREIKPQHLFDLGDRIGIIDAESSSNYYPEHYDLASCYARTYTITQRLDAANELLKEYYARIKQNREDEEQFKHQLRGLLAWRAIGEYRDGFIGKKLNSEHLELLKLVENNDFGFVD